MAIPAFSRKCRSANIQTTVSISYLPCIFCQKQGANEKKKRILLRNTLNSLPEIISHPQKQVQACLWPHPQYIYPTAHILSDSRSPWSAFWLCISRPTSNTITIPAIATIPLRLPLLGRLLLLATALSPCPFILTTIVPSFFSKFNCFLQKAPYFSA